MSEPNIPQILDPRRNLQSYRARKTSRDQRDFERYSIESLLPIQGPRREMKTTGVRRRRGLEQ